MAWLKKSHRIWFVVYRSRGLEKALRVGPDEVQARNLCETMNAARRRARTPEDMAQLLEATAAEVRGQLVTLDGLVADYLNAKRAETRGSTMDVYTLHLEGFAAAFRGGAWKALSLGRINSWLATQKNRQARARSLKTFGRYLHMEKVWLENPLMRLKVGKKRARREKLTDEQVAATEDALAGTELLGPFRAGWMAGLRADEICHLRLENIDREARIAWVREYKGWKPKTGERPVGLNRKLLAEIREGSAGYAFVQMDGQPWGRHKLYREMRKRGHCALHILRHTFISRVLLVGASTLAAQEQAGHTNLATTTGYAHADNRSLVAAVDMLG